MTKTLLEKLIENGATPEEAAQFVLERKAWEEIFHEALASGMSLIKASAYADKLVYKNK